MESIAAEEQRKEQDRQQVAAKLAQSKQESHEVGTLNFIDRDFLLNAPTHLTITDVSMTLMFADRDRQPKTIYFADLNVISYPSGDVSMGLFWMMYMDGGNNWTANFSNQNLAESLKSRKTLVEAYEAWRQRFPQFAHCEIAPGSLSAADGETEQNRLAEEPAIQGNKNLSDVSFARKTFEALARGESSVADKIDWPAFTSLGENLGPTYSGLSTEVDKEKFTTGFITQFATSFRQSGGTVANFTNWRVTLHDAMKTEVSADSPNGVLTILVGEREGVERVSSLNIVR